MATRLLQKSFFPALFLLNCLSGIWAADQAPTLTAPKVDKPNIIFILADDLGIDGLSCFGSDQYKTPQIDALAKGGIKFTHTYAEPLCGPSRITILTGRYVFRTGGVNQDMSSTLPTPDKETMMPKILKPQGYVSAMIGKWGQLPLKPSDYGFDEYLMYKGSGIYWNTQKKGGDYLINGETAALKDQEYMPDRMHNLVVDFMTRNQDKPFYIYYSLSHVHNEILPTPDSAPDSKDLYGDNIVYMDKLMGKLVTELERLKLREKTILVFVGDNGTAKVPAEKSTVEGKPIFDTKGSLKEGGSLVPMIVNWPGTTPTGRSCPDLIDFSDFVPTFAELTGAKLPEGVVIDGHSFAPQIRGEKGSPRDWIFIQLSRSWYVRNLGWRLSANLSEQGVLKEELFDMSEAPFGEKLIPTDSTDPIAIEERKKLKEALDKLNPAGGIMDPKDGTGRHGAKNGKKKKTKDSATE